MCKSVLYHLCVIYMRAGGHYTMVPVRYRPNAAKVNLTSTCPAHVKNAALCGICAMSILYIYIDR